MRILIAEDQRDLNQLLKKRLKEAGYSVDACFDGAAVFDYLLGAEYDALVLDIMMPKVDGIQVVRRLRPALAVPAVLPAYFASLNQCLIALRLFLLSLRQLNFYPLIH